MKVLARPLAVASLWLFVLICFIGLAIRAATGSVLAIDVSIAAAVQNLPHAVAFLFGLENWLGDTAPLIGTTLVLALALFWRGSKGGALLMLFSLVPRSADVIVKLLVSEPRPAADLIRVAYPHDNLSFPSGHVIGVTLVFTLLFVLAPKLSGSGSRLTVALLRCLSLLLIATIGLARIWAGAHWPSDTLGGYLYAMVFMIPMLWWHRDRDAASEAPGCTRTTQV